ncbi:major capsid protein [Microbulbifer sp. 2205BS26-8]|uniref:major capsid protein n=1 Tax=Microbulbifer sp. 2205BS26-8 TaxID=3064386 RepID=UPI00273D91B1|nr:major capsid protein [Microbulbifer sp. 2205BS26-8]MDP5210000.1 major capsid protein [Microbulbifer sp. 2205BS26-8]
MEIVDVLANDAFSMVTMTEAIATAPTQPRELKNSGIFVQEPIRTEMAVIEFREGKLEIAPLDERGATYSSSSDEPRKIRHFKTKRVARHKRLTASDLAFVRQFGSNETQIVEELQKEIARWQTGGGGLIDQCENRLELMRLGALNGLLLDQEGRTVYDFHAEFGITAPPKVFLDIANTSEFQLRKKVESKITRTMRRKAKGRFVGEVKALCGEAAWDALMANAEFNKRYEAAADAKMAGKLTEGTLGTEVSFAGVTWKEYFGADDGSSINLAPAEIKFFPGKGSNIFRHMLSPGETFDDLAQQGREWYSYLVPDREFPSPRWVDLYVAQYPMIVNTAPDLVFPASSAAS